VTPQGVGTSDDPVVKSSIDDLSLKLCAGAAVHGVRYPKGDEGLDLEVQIVWVVGPPNIINMKAHIAGRHEATNTRIDL
jgi:hypothetical protein